MKYDKGAVVTCDRCGNKTFVRYTGTDEFDGGWTLVDRFEKPPEGWEEIIFNYKDLYQHKFFCPTCSQLFHEITALYEIELLKNGLVEEEE